MGRVSRALLMSFALAYSLGVVHGSDAWAQDTCAAAYTHADWRKEMDDIDGAFKAFDLDAARIKIDSTWRNVGCLNEVAHPGHIARFARQRALLYFFDQDEDSAIKWGLLSRYAAPDFPWPADMAEDHPFREMLTNAEDPPIGGPDDASLLIEKKGAAFINGKPLLEPKARAEVPNLIQIADKKGAVLVTFWQDGAAFATDMIGPPGVVLEVPKWYVPVTSYADAGGEALFGSDAVVDGGNTTDGGNNTDGGNTTQGTGDPTTDNKRPTVTSVVLSPDPARPGETVTATASGSDPEGDAIQYAYTWSVNGTVIADATGTSFGGFEAGDRVSVVVVPSDAKGAGQPSESAALTIEKPEKESSGGGIKISRLAIGGGLGLAAGTMWFVGHSASAAFMSGESPNDSLASTRTTANLMLLSSGLVGAAALGVGVTAFVSDGGPQVGVSVRF